MKLDLILENVKNKYTMGLLEESELPEVELLAGKILINESIMNIRNMLVEEGTMSAVQSLLQENWEMTLFEEAVHANHPHLNKQEIHKVVQGQHRDKPYIQKNRNELAMDIKQSRQGRDEYRKDPDYRGSGGYGHTNISNDQKANANDNHARAISQGGKQGHGFSLTKEGAPYNNANVQDPAFLQHKMFSAAPRMVRSATDLDSAHTFNSFNNYKK